MKKKRVVLDASAFIAIREVDHLDLLDESFSEIILPTESTMKLVQERGSHSL